MEKTSGGALFKLPPTFKGEFMFQKRKKFKEETTPEKRLIDRWDQQVFFITKKYPQSKTNISAIMRDHGVGQSIDFIPSEDALVELAKLYTDLQSHS